MEQAYWEALDEREMWLRTIGLEAEDATETAQHADTIFGGIPDGQICLEIGAGVGRLLRPASRHFKFALGVDYSAALQKRSLEYLKEFPSCKVLLTDGMTLPFPDRFFDFVYSFTVFHHMPTVEMVRSNLAETYRVLRSGTLCRIQTVQGEGEGYDGHVYPSAAAFWNEFALLGFVREKIEVLKAPRDDKAARIWITARKP
jgi:ubiquinone/menaquinone biosynthesis C-methylase UbiE